MRMERKDAQFRDRNRLRGGVDGNRLVRGDFTWAVSACVLNSAPSRTDRLMVERSAILVAADANMQKAR